MKIFFMCTHCNQGTGYGRVANKITNYLAAIPKVKVVYYAFQNYPGQDIKDRFIDPRIKFYDAIVEDPESPKGFGDKGIVPAIRREKPDAIFIYNDIAVATSVLKLIPSSIMPPKKYLYLDLVYPWERIDYFEDIKSFDIDKIFTFTNYWRDHMINDMGFEKDRIQTMYHGLDFERFVDVPQEKAKIKLGYKPDDFLVINMNRNSYRKQWATTIRAFMDFLVENNMNPKIKLFCGCLMDQKDGYDIPKLVITECRRRKIDEEIVLNNHIFKNPKPLHLTDEEVNDIYNAGDVGLNTCCGEGFGLTTLEHSYFNRPQIVSGVPSLKETLDENSYIIEPKMWSTVTNSESHSGDIAYFDHRDFTEKLHECFKERQKVCNSRDRIVKMFNWGDVLKELDVIFE